jgi:hypothetical protein
MNFAIYIFSWYQVEGNVKNIVKSLRESGFNDLHIISSGRHSYVYDNVKIIEIESDSFYGDQFRAAVNHFREDIFVQIQGDITIKSQTSLLQRLTDLFQDQRISIWTPNINFTSWKDEIIGYNASQNPYFSHLDVPLDSDLLTITNSDSTFWAVRGSLIHDFKNLELINSKYGWGIDLTLAGMATLRGQLIIRDNTIKISHPKSTGYNKDFAIEEWLVHYLKLPLFLRQFIFINSILLSERSQRYNKKYSTRFKNILELIKSKSRFFKIRY